jgi:FAD/FMN-containing dehydrogenase
MPRVRFASLEGEPVDIDGDALRRLERDVRGQVCLPGDAGYAEARTLWNAAIDRWPGAVVRCAGAGDVVAGVGFARDHGLLLAIRAGGHNIAGNAVGDGGLLLDLSPMRGVLVDRDRRQARVEGGALLGDLDRATQAHGLAVPLGINSTTGVGGLTLGGGYGWLTRKHGMTIDNLLAADVVTAAGELVEASPISNPDLFWAIRGGGGNFGVVTAFRFKLHPVGPEVLAGLIVHPFARARELLAAFRRHAALASEDVTCMTVIRKAPPLPFLPPAVHGETVVVFAACCLGSADEAARALAPLREAAGPPLAEAFGLQPYADWQAAFDPLVAAGARNYWKSHDFERLDDELLDVIVAHASRLPTTECEVFLPHFGGAMRRVAGDATAFPHREMEFLLNIHARWREPGQDAPCIAWARAFAAAAAPHATGGVYVNFMPVDEVDRIGAAYGANHGRLAALKARYDPHNLFRLNQNIRPAA